MAANPVGGAPLHSRPRGGGYAAFPGNRRTRNCRITTDKNIGA